MEKEKIMIGIITTQMEDTVVLQGNTSGGGRGGRGRGRGGRGGRGNNNEHMKNVECFNCGKKGHCSTDCSLPRKN
jgi:hypothetical protein